jgi:hypothetical protein
MLNRTLAAIFVLALTASAQTLQEYSMEARFQLDLHVSDAALAEMMPQGWQLNVATSGNAKDCNLRVLFVDRITINGPDGKPVGKGANQLIYLAAPVKDAAGNTAQMVIGGLTADSADAPGPFGNYLLATKHSAQRNLMVSSAGPAIGVQDWAFSAASGEHIELHLRYESGSANKGNATDVRFYSAKNPAFYQISHQEQVLDILRNTTSNPPDRVKEFTFTAGGGKFAKLFDGSQKYLSWDNILWQGRAVSLP